MVSEASKRLDGTTLILRLWRDGGEAEPWRCSVEDTVSRQRRGFSSLADLMPFLITLTADRTTGPEVEAPRPDHAPLNEHEVLSQPGGDNATTTDDLAGAGSYGVARGDDPRPGSRPTTRLRGRDGVGPVGDR